MDGQGDNISIISSDSESSEKEKRVIIDVINETPTIPIPEYTDEELNKLVKYVQKMVVLFSLKESDFNDDVNRVIKRWLMEVNELVLTVFFDENLLSACLAFPLAPVYDITYFLRDPNHIFTVQGFHDEVIFGTMHEDVDGSLLCILETVYAPIFFNFTEWTENVKGYISTAMHNFLAYLTGLHYKLSGLTVLYVPNEGHTISAQAAAKDRDMLKRLELISNQWMSQIRLCLNDTQQLVPYEQVCPTDEFDFWVYRFEILKGLQLQLDHKNILHIINILLKAQSVYLKPLRELINENKLELEKAKSNIDYLQILIHPCLQLEQSDSPADIPNQLPRIMHLIRVIWKNSSFFNTSENISGLFRGLSNQIIIFCRAKLDVKNILKGNSRSGMILADMSIDCCMCYKEIYKRISEYHKNRNPELGWNLDYASIFNHVDAFIQRLSDLIDICEAMIVFGRYDETENIPAPLFAGTRGLEFQKTCEGIESIFNESLKNLRNIAATILDVHDNSWYVNVTTFRNTLRDLEEIVENLIANVFLSVCNPEEGLEALCTLYNFSQRKNLRPAYLRKVSEVWNLLCDTITRTNKQIVSFSNIRPSILPPFSGKSTCIRIRINRLERLMQLFEEAEWLPMNSNAYKARAAYDTFVKGGLNNINKLNDKWLDQLGIEVVSRLNRPLMNRSVTHKGLLECNIDPVILLLCEESKYFHLLGYEVPTNINKVYSKYKTLKFVFDSVVTVVLDYNLILSALSPKERILFKALISACDKKIMPGIFKLTWGGELSDAYIAECVRHTAQLQEFVDIYKLSNLNIVKICEKICDTPILQISNSSSFALHKFVEHMEKLRRATTYKLLDANNNIIKFIIIVYEGFESHIDEMDVEWLEYIRKFDSLLELALRICSRNSLLNIYNALHGDGGTGPSPLIETEVDLVDNKLTFSPLMQEIADVFGNMFNLVIASIKLFPRIAEQFGLPNVSKLFQTVIKEDDECVRLHKLILEEISICADLLNNYTDIWAPFKMQWELDKELFMKKYDETATPANVFDTNITRYTEIANQVSMQETVKSVYFLTVNSNKLKNSIIAHIDEWIKCHTELLRKIACDKLNAIFDYTKNNVTELLVQPKTISAMEQSILLYEKLVEEIPLKEAEFPSIYDYFRTLDKYEVVISSGIRHMLQTLEAQWEWYLKKIKEGEEMLDNSKDQFKLTLLNEADALKKDSKKILDEFFDNAPFTSNWSPSDAVTAIAEMRRQLQELYDRESQLISDLAVFHINQPENLDLRKLDKELKQLEEVWGYACQWDEAWTKYKTGNFWEIQTDEMEELAMFLFRKLNRLCKQLKEKNWEILETTRRQVDEFRRTLPLLIALKNPAMRPRHWDRVRNIMGVEFDENSEDFKLEAIIAMNFQKYADEIADISNAATMELQIENGIKNIRDIWLTMAIEIVPFRDNIYRIKSVDDCFVALEENSVIISTMKATRFVEPFAKEVDYWERTLSYIMETLENALDVQRQWLYLENIFSGEDIRKQLPVEAKNFSSLTDEWRDITTEMNKGGTALKATHYKKPPYLLNKLVRMTDQLEVIQRALEVYLETKRQLFPRFYFISNDDLLEILSNAKKPDAVQVHMKKLFDNLNKVKLTSVQRGKLTVWEAHGMFSDDGEFVQFLENVILEGPAEKWLTLIERAMRLVLKLLLKQTRQGLKKMLSKRDKWLNLWPGQLLLTSSQIQWTTDCTRSLIHCKILNEKKPLKRLRRKQNQVLLKLSEMSRRELPKQLRLKVNTMITIEIHGRDVIDKMYRMNCRDVAHFEWFSQLRFYWDREHDDCLIRQTNTHFWYGYEYTGNSGRLVITPLTDRCYITLTTALHLHRGGSPKGPAGTGKTETVKDLGKALGMWVIVNNCSEGLDYKSMGKCFSGLAQTGAWGCFDEFNRINIEVLSVVAQQILSILSALSQGAKKFLFEGTQIALISTIGLFITMNPGYAGRTELPDNLKSMFRPISMIVPDNIIIAENLLFSDGFQNTKVLAKKVFTLYELAKQQLSKQHHYDFGLRSMVALLRYAGSKRRQFPAVNEDEIVYLAMKDMNIAKLTSDDFPLFNGIMSDIFPGVTIPVIDYEEFLTSIQTELLDMGLQSVPIAVTKVIQLYETKNSRHSVMILGNTGTAKSVTWKVLKGAYGRMKNIGKSGWYSVMEYPVNPKSLSLGELYGEYNLSTGEWLDGVLSAIMRKICADENPDLKWMLFDGPVDAVWIENMNSVMDDNKVLTLINSERITMPQQVSLLFEVGDLSVASPATVSRCGMVYNDYKDWGWEPYINSWVAKQKPKSYQNELQLLFKRFFNKVLYFKEQKCEETVPVNELTLVISFCKLMDCLATKENGIDPNNEDTFETMVKLWFLFCMIWSLCGTVNEEGRLKFDAFIREMEGVFPLKDTIYDYYVDTRLKTLISWEDKLSSQWRYPKDAPFYKIIVPTVDTIRYDFLVSKLLAQGFPVLLVGSVGTGKSSTAINVLEALDNKKYSLLLINMSAQTTSNNVQDTIESRTEKRTKGVYVPIGGKTMVCFMDDFNMPAKEVYGSQPPLELIRQWIDYGFWYDRHKQWRTYVKQMLLMSAMGPAGGGRQVISPRTLSRFNVINMTFPSEATIQHIFGTMLAQQLSDFPEEIKQLGKTVTLATIDLYKMVIAKMLPTPAKIHYLFNLRDISKIFQGLLRSNHDFHNHKPMFLRLWLHECFRVFSDRLIDNADQDWFLNQISNELGQYFELTFHNLCPSKTPPVFGDFISAFGIYEDLNDQAVLRNYMAVQLDDYNNSPNVVRLDLVLFKDAIEHIIRIIRVISQPRGNMLLIGIGGSGRQSLSKVAAYICEYNTFQIEVSKNYRTSEFREDLKILYQTTGVENKQTSFLFNDTQVVDESFLEIINNMLSTGEVSNLYKPDEFEEIKNNLEIAATKAGITKTTEAMFTFFIERARANTHIIVCMSPIGNSFSARIRQYPALVNCTTIDWFREWPEEALLEVANKYLLTCKLDVTITKKEENRESLVMATEDRLRIAVAATFAIMHTSVCETSLEMLLEMKRHNYVTPTNYLELVAGFQKMLNWKRNEISSAANKLRNGLFKIDDTREKVEVMSEELKDSQEKVIEFQAQCDKFIIVIEDQTKEADEQKREVAFKSVKIGEEEAECKVLAAVAQTDLDKAMPALNAALQALDALSKKDVNEVKSYARPPIKVEKVMEAVMILIGKEPTWVEAKRMLGEQRFLEDLKNFDRNNISDKTLKRIAIYTQDTELDPEKVGTVSFAAKSLCLWVRAIERYGKVYRVVAPKQKLLDDALASLKIKQDLLAEAQEKLAELTRTLQKLQKEYEEKSAMKEQLRLKAEHLKLKLERAYMLVDGLAGERLRWMETVKRLDKEFGNLPGDCLIATAFISYLGPFVTQYREKLGKLWSKVVISKEIPFSSDFCIYNFLSDATTIREWNIQGLPSDEFSTENGIIVTRGSRWPLIIDPQTQAHRWIRNMEKKHDLKIIDFGQPDYVRTLENSVQFGKSVLLQNVMETLDPSLTPILTKALIKQGGQLMIKFNDKMITYNENFRFFITTKLSNPHYAPEISTKTTLVNFAVKEVGLQAQLLGIVVRKERPSLEEQKDSLVVNIAKNKRTLIDLENEILRLLNESRGSILDDEELFSTLQSSKQTSIIVTESLETAEITEIEIDAAREGYRPSAKRAAILFFVLMDMSRIDPMYQFSLDAYILLFTQSIERSPKNPVIAERISNLNEFHTYSVYRNTCRGLFEMHKLLFSFHMCAKILEAAEKLNLNEYNFLLKGGIVLDRQEQVENPCPSWISDTSWDNITELDKLPGLHGIADSFEQYPRDWHEWYQTTEPESIPLIGEWDDIMNDFQKIMIIRSLRPDRITSCVTTFIISQLGHKFVEPPVLDVKAVFDESLARTPLIFVLSAGVDPTNSLLQLAETCNMANKFFSLSLGQGQAPVATSMISKGAKDGNWIFLANCHLSLSWMPKLDKIVETLQSGKIHNKFRLWLSSSPNPEFPISILQAGIKMTTEPPKGIKANLKRLYNIVTEEQFASCKAKDKYKKLLFSLCFFHAILLERKKFQQLGWNVIYSFNDSDFEVSENLLSLYLDEYPETPWDALKYLIAGVNYGGHVTDDWDRRLLSTYINELYNETVLEISQYRLSSLTTYYIPRNGTLQSYQDYISLLPNVDRPEAFGQHPNADIASLIIETRILFETLVSLQVQSSQSGGETKEDKVFQLANDILLKVPDPIDYEGTIKLIGIKKTPLDVVLLQEIERYNVLLVNMKTGLEDLKKGIKGLVVMSSDLEDIFNSMFEGKVPTAWLKAYSSLKPLGAWARDLVLRIQHFAVWAQTTHEPLLFWLAAYTFPTGFLTGVLQTSARASKIPIDALGWEFVVFMSDEKILDPPSDGGVYVKGLFLEGAGWNKKSQCLKEPLPMELVCKMPLIHFKPVEQLKKRTRGLYQCPSYYFPERSGSFIIAVDLKVGTETSDFWIKRGTAILLSLAN